eukprot:30996-Pelagococcus_subviridis.AAC.16
MCPLRIAILYGGARTAATTSAADFFVGENAAVGTLAAWSARGQDRDERALRLALELDDAFERDDDVLSRRRREVEIDGLLLLLFFFFFSFRPRPHARAPPAQRAQVRAHPHEPRARLVRHAAELELVRARGGIDEVVVRSALRNLRERVLSPVQRAAVRPERLVRRERAPVHAPLRDGYEPVRRVRDGVEDDAAGRVRALADDADERGDVDDAAEDVGDGARGDDFRSRGDRRSRFPSSSSSSSSSSSRPPTRPRWRPRRSTTRRRTRRGRRAASTDSRWPRATRAESRSRLPARGSRSLRTRARGSRGAGTSTGRARRRRRRRGRP